MDHCWRQIQLLQKCLPSPLPWLFSHVFSSCATSISFALAQFSRTFIMHNIHMTTCASSSCNILHNMHVFFLLLGCLLHSFTLSGLHAAPLDKSLQKGGVHAIASNLNKHADMPTALGEGGDQVIDKNPYIFPLILFHFHHLQSTSANR